MVCTAKDLLEWKNFPKGLKVLLLDKDASYASEIRSKLEGMDYIATTFYHEDEALSAVLNKFDAFHVAIVEVSTIDCDGNFKFLQMAKGLPTIMVADAQCVTTTMKCIALGAVEVLSKPLCADKLRNIWQHVVHKAYNVGESATAGSQRPVIDSMILMEKEQVYQDEQLEEVRCLSDEHCGYDQACSSGNDKYPAPPTPQPKQVRLQDDAGCNDRTNWSTEKDNSVEHCEESKSVETTCCNAAPDIPLESGQLMHDSADGCKSESDTSPHRNNGPETRPHGGNALKQTKASESRGPCGPKTNCKKMKVDWTSDLHKKFVQAVEQLGVDQAIPSRILELMKVEGLTRHNIASHLQKYRMHRRYALPKREERRIPLHPKDTMQSSHYYQHKPMMPYPTPHYHSNHALHANQAYPVWIQPGSHTASPPYPTWPWKSYTMMHADAWTCPVMPSLQGSYSYYPRNASGCYGRVVANDHDMPTIAHDDRLQDEIIDKIIKEAINEPWVPLPIGLKPPSTESVLVELSKQGISNIPPTKHQLMDC